MRSFTTVDLAGLRYDNLVSYAAGGCAGIAGQREFNPPYRNIKIRQILYGNLRRRFYSPINFKPNEPKVHTLQ